MYDLEIQELALIDLANISNYIFQESFSKELSDKKYDEIMASILTLKIFPFAFPLLEGNYRMMTVKKKYRVYYNINENDKIVVVQYIHSTSQEIVIH